MDSSGEAIVEPFSIGPSSIAGRTLALRILFCKWSLQSLSYFCILASRHIRMFNKTFFRPLASSLLSLVDPRRPSTILASAVAASLFLRRSRTLKLKAEASYRQNFWRNMINSVNTYEEWAHANSMLEKNRSRRRDSDLYDEELVNAKLSELRRRRLQGSVDDILFCLRADLVRNLGNMCNPELHQGRLQTPRLIREYINEVSYHLRAVCEKNSGDFSLDEKIAFIYETRHAFGRTALLLSGGAGLGAFHLGVVRTLIEHRLFPRVIAGSSVGSIICSFAASRTWPELLNFFDDPNPPVHFFESMGSIFESAYMLLTRGAVQDIGHLQRKMRQLIGDLTFQEAYDISGRVLAISVSSRRRHDPPRCLNYLTSPHVVIWSAVTASCAFPGLFEAQELMGKDSQGRLVPYHHLAQAGQEGVQHAGRQWRDGSLEIDLPMMHLKELFNVNHFIVSQANPHIAPLLRVKEAVRTYGGDLAGKLANLVEMEVKHRCKQALEFGFSLGGTAKLFSQPWEGDITIVIPTTLAQFAKLIQNPTAPSLRKAVMQGRRCTWAKLSAIQANCGIELILDECVIELNRQRHAEKNLGTCLPPLGFAGVAKRIPSWVCLAQEISTVERDDGFLGGPWGGPSVKKVRSVHNSIECDDFEHTVESFDQSWTQAGGPLMKSPSAHQLIVMLDDEKENKTGAAQINDRSNFQSVGIPRLARTHSLEWNKNRIGKNVAMRMTFKAIEHPIRRGRSKSLSDIVQSCSFTGSCSEEQISFFVREATPKSV